MVLAIVALALLVWIGLILTKLLSVNNEMRRTDTFPDSVHPAFSRAQISSHYEAIKNTGIKAAQLQDELNGVPEFAEASPGYIPSPTVESKMGDICMEIAFWYGYLKNVEFMLEANLMVQRGELTIAEARQVYEEINTGFGSPQGSESSVMLKEWKDRMALKAREAPTALSIAEKALADFEGGQAR